MDIPPGPVPRVPVQKVPQEVDHADKGIALRHPGQVLEVQAEDGQDGRQVRRIPFPSGIGFREADIAGQECPADKAEIVDPNDGSGAAGLGPEPQDPVIGGHEGDIPGHPSPGDGVQRRTENRRQAPEGRGSLHRTMMDKKSVQADFLHSGHGLRLPGVTGGRRPLQVHFRLVRRSAASHLTP